MNSDVYCQNKVAARGSSLYYALRDLPPDQRRAITALYALRRELHDIVDECSDPGIARTKLAWWREEIEHIHAGKPQHPVTQALGGAMEQFTLPLEYFREMIDGAELALERIGYASFKDLSLYCHRLGGVVGILTAEILGYRDRHTLKYAHTLGMAVQLTDILRAVRKDMSRGRTYIPQDELARFAVTPADLTRPQTTGRLRELFHFQAERVRDHYRRALEQLPECDRYNQRSGLILAHIHQALLDEIERDGFQILEHRIHLTPLRKLWLAWNIARREKRRWKAARTFRAR